LRRIRLLALGYNLLDDGLDARGWDRLAIYNGNVLRKSWYSDNEKCNQQLGWLESHY